MYDKQNPRIVGTKKRKRKIKNYNNSVDWYARGLQQKMLYCIYNRTCYTVLAHSFMKGVSVI
uniref:Uncharacterized protein n=1 Tax=Rhizophora mucronata TaxID=61149 RepID=A0A2P2QYY3_RHIMU